MKKCPYCAEEIQEEAKKCKHCGEWLVVPGGSTGADRSDTSKEGREVKDKTDSGEQNLEPTTPRTTDSIQYSEIPGVKPLPKKPGKYGWGWFVFLGILANYDIRSNPFTDYTLSLIWGILTLFFLIPYFALRRWFLKKWDFPESKPWKAGLAAAFCTYLLVCLVLGVMVFFDARSLNTTIRALDEKYKARVAAFMQEEASYQTRFISEPQTKRDIEQNIKTIDEIVATTKQKQTLFVEMFNDYKQTLKDKRTAKGKKSWGDSIDQILAVYGKCMENQLNAWALLRKHYVTGDEKYHQDYTTAYQTSARLADEFQRLFKETFGVTGNK